MTPLALAALALLSAISLYLAVRAGRLDASGAGFLDGGAALPAWTLMFAGAGALVACLNLRDHLLMTTLYGLQASHVALGLAVAALAGAMAHKRLALAARALATSSPVEILSGYYGSVALRVALVGVALMFAWPFAASLLSGAGELVARTTGGRIEAAAACAVVAFALFLVSALGGWRGVAYVVAAQSLLMLALLVFLPLFLAGASGDLAALRNGPTALKGVLADQIPGVVQYSAGVGKDAAAGGPFTALTILGAGAALIGAALSPAVCLLATSARARTGLAFQQVWMTAGLATGALLLAAPILAAEIVAADPNGYGYGAPHLGDLVGGIAEADYLAAAAFLVLMLAAAQVGVALFVSAAANLFAGDVVGRYLAPELDARGRRLAARIALAVLYAAAAATAIYAPLPAAILAPATLPLAAQLLPAFIGLAWAPWISRQAVVTGFTFGALMVAFTEPPGLVAFEGLFLDLPWGRWPLTVPSTLWGLAANVGVVLLVSLFTRGGMERERRERLHAALRRADPRPRASALTTAKWSLTLIWIFFAMGPGAVLGNSFFSKPVFTEGEAKLGLPSLWVWQVLFGLVGVMLVWWLAYRGRLGVMGEGVVDRLQLDEPVARFGRRAAPTWLQLLVDRLAGRP